MESTMSDHHHSQHQQQPPAYFGINPSLPTTVPYPSVYATHTNHVTKLTTNSVPLPNGHAPLLPLDLLNQSRFLPSLSPSLTTESSPSTPVGGPPSTVDEDEYPSLAPRIGGGGHSLGPSPLANGPTQARQKMAVRPSTLTQIVNILYEERRFKPSHNNQHLGEPQNTEQNRVCSDIMQRTGAHLELQSNADNSLTVLIQGKLKNVEDAKRLVTQQLQTQASILIDIPKEYHVSLLGKGGLTLRAIEEQSGARVNLPHRKDPSNEIRIKGSRAAIAEAALKLKEIYEEQSKYATQRISVEKEYLPFIRGPNGQFLAGLEEKTGVKTRFPPTSGASQDLVITGLRDGVSHVVTVINSIQAEKKRTCTKFAYKIDRAKHKYIIGPRGSHLQEVLAATGVSVILPAADAPEDEADIVVLLGPTRLHGNALTLVLDKANSMISEALDVPRWIHKHIIKAPQGEGVKDITTAFPKVYLDFKRDADVINIEGPPEDVQKVFIYLQGLIKQICQRVRILEIPVDTKLHPHIVGKGGIIINKIRDVSGVDNIKVPGDKGPNFVQLEGSPDAIAVAHREILDIVDKKENEKSDEVVMDPRFHPLIIGPNGEKIKEIRDRFNSVVITIPRRGNDERDKDGHIYLRGDKKDVDNCRRYLEEMKKSFAQFCFGDFALPDKFAKCHTISQLRYKRYLRERYPTIDFRFPAPNPSSNASQSSRSASPAPSSTTKPARRDNKQTPAAANKASNPDRDHHKFTVRTNDRADLDDFKKDFPDTLVEVMMSCSAGNPNESNPPQESATTLNPSGGPTLSMPEKAGLVKKCEKEFGATVRFPSPRDAQADIITIFGQKVGVEKAKNFIKQSLTDLNLRVTLDCAVEPKYFPIVLGAKGSRVNDLSQRYCVKIKMPERKVPRVPATTTPGEPGLDHAPAAPQPETDHLIHITGKMEDCQKTREAILSIIPCTDSVPVPIELHSMIIGPRGRDIRAFTNQYRVNLAIPSPTDDTDLIKISGSRGNVTKAKEALESSIPEWKQQLTEKELTAFTQELEIDPKFHSQLIGRRSVDIGKFCAEHGIKVFFPNKGHKVRVVGNKEKVMQASQVLREKVEVLESMVSETFEVSSAIVPRIIGSQGRSIRQLMTKYQVEISTPRSESATTKVTITGAKENVEQAKDYVLLLNLEHLQAMEQRDDQRRSTPAPATAPEIVAAFNGDCEDSTRALVDTRYNAPLSPDTEDRDSDVVEIGNEINDPSPVGSFDTRSSSFEETGPKHEFVAQCPSLTPDHYDPAEPSDPATAPFHHLATRSPSPSQLNHQHNDTSEMNGSYEGTTPEVNGYSEKMPNGGIGDHHDVLNGMDACLSDPEEPFLPLEQVYQQPHANGIDPQNFYQMISSKAVQAEKGPPTSATGLNIFKKQQGAGPPNGLEALEEEESVHDGPNNNMTNGKDPDAICNGDGLITV